MPITTAPSPPALSMICFAGVTRARRTLSMRAFSSSLIGFRLASDGDGAQEGNAAAGQDTFFTGRTGCVERIFDAILLLLHLDLGRAAGADEFNQLRETDGPP
jgi:hypothetical protein